MLPSVGQYVEHLERLDFNRQKSELQSFHFKIYQTQGNSYAQQPLKLYSPSVDFNPKFNDTFSGILYPRPVQLTRGEPQEEHEKALCADEINNFLDPFFSELLTQRFPIDKSDQILQNVVSHLEGYIEERREALDQLASAMNVQRLVIPFVEINLPGDLILAYNELEPDDPQVSWYQNHPLLASDIRLLGTFLDRFDTNSEVLCLMLWSTIDSVLINLPSVGLNPYPLCWNCRRSFGMKVCGTCRIAKYCSRDCQLQHWDCQEKVNHKSICQEMKDLCKKHKVLVFKASPEVSTSREVQEKGLFNCPAFSLDD